ncbi:MAG: NUDIX hydrolase [Nanoarchaeota archaeon]
MARGWKKLSSKTVYSNPWIKVQEDKVIGPDGKETIYSYLEKSAGNFIIALDDGGFVYLIREYRYPPKKEFLQLPGGVVDSDDVLGQAKKELREETGITADKWERLGGFYVAPSHETNYINVFLATGLDVSGLKIDNQEHDEAIGDIIRVSVPDLRQMVLAGEVECGITIAALNLFFLKNG